MKHTYRYEDENTKVTVETDNLDFLEDMQNAIQSNFPDLAKSKAKTVRAKTPRDLLIEAGIPEAELAKIHGEHSLLDDPDLSLDNHLAGPEFELKDLLDAAFQWDFTPQGRNYWKDWFMKLKNLERFD